MRLYQHFACILFTLQDCGPSVQLSNVKGDELVSDSDNFSFKFKYVFALSLDEHETEYETTNLKVLVHSQSVTNIQVGQDFIPWSNVSLTNIFVK